MQFRTSLQRKAAEDSRTLPPSRDWRDVPHAIPSARFWSAAVFEAPWTSSPIQFGDNGKMKYSSTISVNGEEFQGLGEIHFSHDRKKLKGKIHMIMGENKLVSADVEFYRRTETGNSRLKEPLQQSLTA